VVRRVPGLIGVSLALEPVLTPADVPAGVQVAFLAANIAGVSLTVYLLLFPVGTTEGPDAFAPARDAAFDSLQRPALAA
jgi:hypothetical protein